MKPPPNPDSVPGPDLLRGLLSAVSRSFYRTLQVLPGPVRQPIGVAYLLARTTDTIADTSLVPVEERLVALETLCRRLDGSRVERIDFRAFCEDVTPTDQATAAERQLLLRVEEAIAVLRTLSPEDRSAVQDVLKTIASGQILDLQRFGHATEERIVALANANELHDYTYRVAGCVGGFWTRLCQRKLFPAAPVDTAALLADGLRFGRGLQLVNILRDIPRDLRQGRCYLPADELAGVGLQPADLLSVENMNRLRPVYGRWLDLADAHLAAGWRYTNRLPFTQWRLRLGCAWPVLIGQSTLRRLRSANVLDATQRVKITRREVRQILVRTVIRLPFRRAWETLGSDGIGPSTAATRPRNFDRG